MALFPWGKLNNRLKEKFDENCQTYDKKKIEKEVFQKDNFKSFKTDDR